MSIVLYVYDALFQIPEAFISSGDFNLSKNENLGKVIT
jgi:hypothetical protein